MNPTLRAASAADLDTLMFWRMRVLAEVFSLPTEADTSELERKNRAYYREAIPAGSHVACFACRDGEIVGCGGLCLYREMPSPDNPSGRCAYLMNVYTAPEHRGEGVGRATVDWLVAQARERGITKIFLETSPAARSLYTSMGFRAMEGMMEAGGVPGSRQPGTHE